VGLSDGGLAARKRETEDLKLTDRNPMVLSLVLSSFFSVVLAPSTTVLGS